MSFNTLSVSHVNCVTLKVGGTSQGNKDNGDDADNSDDENKDKIPAAAAAAKDLLCLNNKGLFELKPDPSGSMAVVCKALAIYVLQQWSK